MKISVIKLNLLLKSWVWSLKLRIDAWQSLWVLHVSSPGRMLPKRAVFVRKYAGTAKGLAVKRIKHVSVAISLDISRWVSWKIVSPPVVVSIKPLFGDSQRGAYVTYSSSR